MIRTIIAQQIDSIYMYQVAFIWPEGNCISQKNHHETNWYVK